MLPMPSPSTPSHSLHPSRSRHPSQSRDPRPRHPRLQHPTPQHPRPRTPEAPAPVSPMPDPEIEPSPELTGMFREQITRMRDDGKSRDEAERVLLRFRLGHRFLGMLDEIYLSGAPSSRRRRKREPFARFRRHAEARPGKIPIAPFRR